MSVATILVLIKIYPQEVKKSGQRPLDNELLQGSPVVQVKQCHVRGTNVMHLCGVKLVSGCPVSETAVVLGM
jgi:hypothetical protein